MHTFICGFVRTDAANSFFILSGSKEQSVWYRSLTGSVPMSKLGFIHL